MSLTTPETIRTLQRKLYTQAKQEPNFRFYALYDKRYGADILSQAYALVRSNTGAPGIDGVTVESIEEGEGKECFLQRLREQVESKTYRTDAVRRVWIPKPDGSQRPLGIPMLVSYCTSLQVTLGMMEPGQPRWPEVSIPPLG